MQLALYYHTNTESSLENLEHQEYFCLQCCFFKRKKPVKQLKLTFSFCMSLTYCDLCDTRSTPKSSQLFTDFLSLIKKKTTTTILPDISMVKGICWENTNIFTLSCDPLLRVVLIWQYIHYLKDILSYQEDLFSIFKPKSFGFCCGKGSIFVILMETNFWYTCLLYLLCRSWKLFISAYQ